MFSNLHPPILKNPVAGFFIRIFIAVLLIIPKEGKSQAIDSTGIFQSKVTNKLYPETVKLKKPVYKENELSKKRIRKFLLEKIQTTILNLENDSTYLKDSYVKIWGKSFFDPYIRDLKILREYLKNGTGTTNTLDFLPQTGEIAQFSRDDPYTINEDGILNAKADRKEFLLYKTDKMSEKFLGSYNQMYDQDQYLKKTEMGDLYISDWRVLEKWYQLILETQKGLPALQNDIYNLDIVNLRKIQNEINAIDPGQLNVVKWIKEGRFVRSWLWLNGGAIRINPLPSTTPDQRYPFSEQNLFLTANQKRLQDSLEKMDAYDVFRTTKKVHNKIILPILDDKSDQIMIQYDASKAYKPIARIDDKYLKDDVQLVLPVYNIPIDKTVIMNLEKKPLAYESRAITALNSMAEGLGAVAALGISNAGAVSKINDLLNTQPLPDITYNISADAKQAKDTLEKFTGMRSTGLKATISRSSIAESRGEDEPVTAIDIDGILVRLTNEDFDEDKKRIIWTIRYGKEKLKDLKDNSIAFDEVLKQFVKSDHYYFLDYSSLGNIRTGISSMTVRFNAFQLRIKEIATEILALTNSSLAKQKLIIPYLRISNRSLPPKDLAEKTDTVPSFYSKIFVPEMPQAPQKVIYTLTESGVAGNKLKEVADETFKVIKTQRFDLSIGLGYTFSEYNVTSNAGASLPVTALGDSFQFQAGVHWYFIHRLNKLNDRIGKNTDERFSLYLGLSLKNALDNYFTGISYDITPGVKIIAGAHFYKNQRFKIVNNAVAEKASGISAAGFFTSLNIEPVTIAKAIGLFK